MSEFTTVTFVGGPLDMTRKAVSADIIRDGCLRAIEHPTDDFTMDAVERRGSMEVRVSVVTYLIRAVGYDKRGNHIFVAVPAP